MKWTNLLDYKCPKCSKDLKQYSERHLCTNCDFFINDKKLNDVVQNMLDPLSKKTPVSRRRPSNEEALNFM